MTAEEMVKRFHAQGPSKGPWRAPCPVHKSRGLTLAIYDDGDRTSVHCHAGCSSDDVLAAVGLTWKDCYYVPRTKLDAKQQAEERRKREAEELKASQLRVGTWILRFIANGYTREDRNYDMGVICACAIVLSNNGGTKAWDTMLRQHLERVEAANFVRRNRMMPEVAKERIWSI